MNRFEFVLKAVDAPQNVPMNVLADEFKQAVDTVMAEGGDPESDPAVVVIGTWVAFRTHADVNTRQGYSTLIDFCRTYFDTYPTFQ